MSAAARPALSQPTEPSVGLPAWIYRDPDFFELEKRTIFRTSWQLVCHANDIPKPGDYHCFDMLGESIVSLRGRDGEIRTFHNVCRHPSNTSVEQYDLSYLLRNRFRLQARRQSI